jgi:hypothetical protein
MSTEQRSIGQEKPQLILAAPVEVESQASQVGYVRVVVLTPEGVRSRSPGSQAYDGR